MFIFEEATYKNFLSTGNIPIVISLNKLRSVLFLGESGSGKSTLLDVICFAAYNKPFRNINKPQLVNTINGKDCVVTLSFSDGNKKYKIVRGIKPDIFEIWLNGTLLSQDPNVDYQSFLEKHILKMNKRSFIQVVLLGASNFTPFMQLKPADRRLIIEELLDISILSGMNVLLKQKNSELKTTMMELDYDISILSERITMQEKYISSLQEDNKKKIKENVARIKNHLKQIEEEKKSISFFESKILDSQKYVADKPIRVKELKEIEAARNQCESDITRLTKEIDFFTNHDSCFTCKQTIESSFKVKEIIELSSEKDLLTGQILPNIEKEIHEKESQIDSIRTIESDISAKRSSIAGHESTIRSIQKFIQDLKKEAETLSKPRSSIGEEEKTLIALTEELAEKQKKKQDYIHDRYIQDLASSLLKDNGIKAKIIQQYLPLINKYVNAFLESMNFFVTFELDEEFKEVIKSRGRDGLSYANFSEGEKQRLDLALLFAWRMIAKEKNSVHTNLLIMDEVVDSYLDQAATESILELLNSDTFKDTNIIMISHKNTIADKFSATKYFKKVKDFTEIDNSIDNGTSI